MVSISGDSITVMVRVRLANQPPLQYHSWIALLDRQSAAITDQATYMHVWLFSVCHVQIRVRVQPSGYG